MDIMAIAISAGTALAAGGAAWGAAKQALNGTKARVEKIDGTLESHVKEDIDVQKENARIMNELKNETVTRLTKLETILQERLPRPVDARGDYS